MTVEQKLKKPYMIKSAIWVSACIVLALSAFFYHSRPESKFPVTGSIAICLFLLALIFWRLGLSKYFFDKSFSGTIVSINIHSEWHMPHTFIPHMYRRTFVLMTVRCDNGKEVVHDQILPEHLSRKTPFQVGDRVYHIKGSLHTCRFPRNDTETLYDPVSVICPICGAVNTLGIYNCAFCKSQLPIDPVSEKGHI